MDNVRELAEFVALQIYDRIDIDPLPNMDELNNIVEDAIVEFNNRDNQTDVNPEPETEESE